MAFSDTIDQIATHATAAGAALTNPITDVRVAWPVPRGRCIRIFWGGEADPVRMGADRVLNGQLVSDRIVWMAFWPLSEFSETNARNLVLDMRLLKHEMRTRIQGDSQLGGQQTDLEMSYADVDFPALAGAQYVTVGAEITTDYTEYAISP